MANQCQCPIGQHACGQRCVSNDDVASCGTSCQACPSPPSAPVCVNSQTLRISSAMPICTAGACGSNSTDTQCPFGCNNGACMGDPCAGVTCTTPPDNTCVTTGTLRTFPAVGVCSAGACTYAPTNIPCPTSEVCATGLCRWNDSRLTALTVTPGSLAFSPTQTMHAVAVLQGTTSVVVTATVAQPSRATVRINGALTASGTPATATLTGSVTMVTVRVEAESGATTTYTLVVTASPAPQQAYIKASNTGPEDAFGARVALSADGSTLAVGAWLEDSNASGVNGIQADDSASSAGAVYVFTRTGTAWAQQAYLKASNTGRGDAFGVSVAVSADGNTLAVGATREASSATGVNGNQADNLTSGSGAVYLFMRTGTAWAQQAYVKASNTGAGDSFGGSVALSADGNALAVGAPEEASSATGVNGNQADDSASRAGAVYVFTRSGTSWAQQAYLKASNTGAGDSFGGSVALSADGNALAVGAPEEASSATGVNGNQADNSATRAGAVYVFSRTGITWAQQTYLKASNTGTLDAFGTSLALSADGSTLAVGATGEASNATGVNGNQAANSALFSGAVYVFTRTGSTWAQQAYLKASNTESSDAFGLDVALSGDGSSLAVGAIGEDGSATGVNGNQAGFAANAGAVYVFTRTGSTWAQQAYLKASNTRAESFFGTSVALSVDGSTLAVGATGETSSATGVNGNQANTSATNAGAVYVFAR